MTASNNTLIFSIAGDNFNLTLTEGIYSGDELALHIYTLMGFGFYHISYNNKTNKFTLSDASDNSGTIANFPGGDETEIYVGSTALDILGISSSDLTTQAANDINFFFFPYISTTTPVFTPLNTIFNTKQDTLTITANRVAVSDANGDLTASATTDTEIGFVSGLSSAIQTQLDTKLEQTNFGTGFIREVGTNNIFLQTSNTVVVSGSNSGTAPTVSAVATGLALKQNSLTFNAPSNNNSNPSTSAQIKSALDLKQDVLTAGSGK